MLFSTVHKSVVTKGGGGGRIRTVEVERTMARKSACRLEVRRTMQGRVRASPSQRSARIAFDDDFPSLALESTVLGLALRRDPPPTPPLVAFYEKLRSQTRVILAVIA